MQDKNNTFPNTKGLRLSLRESIEQGKQKLKIGENQRQLEFMLKSK